MKNPIRSLLYIGLVVVIGAGCTTKQPPLPQQPGGAVEQSNAGSQPAVTAASKLTDYERTYLFWFLKKRLDLKLPNVPVRHVYTSLQRCPDCYNLYYSWENLKVTVRIRVESDEVVEARDTAGFDYLTGSQGEPNNFPELSSARN